MPLREDKNRDVRARRWVIGGRVQGVGFRPFVYRLAHRFGLNGWIQNLNGRVEILGQAEPSALQAFSAALFAESPALARPRLMESRSIAPQLLHGFVIRASSALAPPDIHIPADQAPCADCLRELSDPRDRRYRYPFINCTGCGPRYTLISRLPYDRPNTTMHDFNLCVDCAREYADPSDRRFHAQPIACPACGPRLQFMTTGHDHVSGRHQALTACAAALRAGHIVGVKGIGGYHLMCDALNAASIARLRRAKSRPDKPLAVMFPEDAQLSVARRHVRLDDRHEAVLRAAARPIVLVARREDARLPDDIAPGLTEVGVLLPYSPLHHLLLDAFGGPVIATSANPRGEPLLTAQREVETRLGQVADAWLHHDRPIRHPVDDPVVRLIGAVPRPLRLGRGLAPLELTLPGRLPQPMLAVGGHIKNTIALAWDDRVVVSPHIGDLDSPRSLAAFATAIEELQDLYGVRARVLVCDRHPHYASRRWARECGLPVIEVFHHHAHAAVLAGEFPDIKRWLIFAWDGLGYGPDDTLWGGEALLGKPGAWRRVASLRPFLLPGGEQTAREPWRSALALCWESGYEWARAPRDTELLRHAWRRGINCVRTTSAGRLFDAAAALSGLLTHASYEGHAPMLLEASADQAADFIDLPLAPDRNGVLISDWAPLLAPLADDSRAIGSRAGSFHSSLAHALLAQACAIRARHGAFVIGFSGGVFQNRLLTEQALALLQDAGFETRFPLRLPCNDAGLSYGQIIEAATPLLDGATRT